MQTLGRKWEQSIWQTFWLTFTADHKGKHSWAKIKRAKFDSEEASRFLTVPCSAVQLALADFNLLQRYKTFAKRHHRRRHNEFVKQQASKGWDDVWDTVSLYQ